MASLGKINLKIIKDPTSRGDTPISGGMIGPFPVSAEAGASFQSALWSHYPMAVSGADENGFYDINSSGVPPTYGVSGLTGNCAEFAVNNFVYGISGGGTGRIYDPGTQKVQSLNVWVNPDVIPPAATRTIMNHNNGGNDGFLFYVDTSGLPTVEMYDGAAALKKATGPALTQGAWNMVTFVLDSLDDQTLTVYTNAVAGTPVAITSMAAALSHTVTVGASSNSWDGKMEDMSYATRVFSQTEITWLYNGGAGRTSAEFPSLYIPCTEVTEVDTSGTASPGTLSPANTTSANNLCIWAAGMGNTNYRYSSVSGNSWALGGSSSVGSGSSGTGCSWAWKAQATAGDPGDFDATTPGGWLYESAVNFNIAPSGGSAPVVASSQVSSDTGASELVHVAPAGISSGDLLIIITASDYNLGADILYPPPGWNKLVENNTGGSVDSTCAVFWRVADGSSLDGNAQVNSQSGLMDLVGFYLRITGAKVTA